MGALLAGLWAKFSGFAIAVGAFVLALGAAVFYGREKGKASMRPEVDQAQDKAASATAANQQLESRNETDAAVQKLPDAPPGVALGDAPADSAAGKLSDWAD